MINFIYLLELVRVHNILSNFDLLKEKLLKEKLELGFMW